MVRLGPGAYAYERVVVRSGLGPVAGADEAGRGACAGPLVAAAAILDPNRTIAGLDDSKALTAAARQRMYGLIMQRAVAVAVAVVEPEECDALGMHQADLHALRRAVGRLEVAANFVITDGFPVDGLGVPGVAMWKGDKVSACVSAASIVAKVTRDQIMADYHGTYPDYGFDIHKGYCTAAHQKALEAVGPSEIHRWCFDNVARLAPGGRASLAARPI